MIYAQTILRKSFLKFSLEKHSYSDVPVYKMLQLWISKEKSDGISYSNKPYPEANRSTQQHHMKPRYCHTTPFLLVCAHMSV